MTDLRPPNMRRTGWSQLAVIAVALGKASSLVGVGVLGAVVGLIIELLPDAGTLSAVGHDVDVSIVVIAAALLLAAAGLLLERAGIDPGRDRESRH